MILLKSYAKVADANVKALEFGPGNEFNGAKGPDVRMCMLRREMRDSFEIIVEAETISEFKLTNQEVLTWDDHWLDSKTGRITDPVIQSLDLKRNRLVYVNINTPRLHLKKLNLEGNKDLQVLHLHECPALEYLDISGCTSLLNVSLGLNRSIRTLSARDCAMTPAAMEQLLRDFTPTVTASANGTGAGMFRKPHSTLLDLRGNTVDWSNRRIASKIRMLLVNNWIVKWDNDPPADVVPPQLYGFFVESLL